MVLDPPLGDVVQEQCYIEQGAMLGQNLPHQVAGKHELIVAATFDLREDADAAQQVLVHGVVVIHVELHHRDDAAERRHEAAEHAGLVHPPQHGLGVVIRGQDLEEQPVRLLVLAHDIGVQHQMVLLRQTKHPDEVDRIAREYVLVGDGEAIVVVEEVFGLGKGAAATRGAKLRHHPA